MELTTAREQLQALFGIYNVAVGLERQEADRAEILDQMVDAFAEMTRFVGPMIRKKWETAETGVQTSPPAEDGDWRAFAEQLKKENPQISKIFKMIKQYADKMKEVPQEELDKYFSGITTEQVQDLYALKQYRETGVYLKLLEEFTQQIQKTETMKMFDLGKEKTDENLAELVRYAELLRCKERTAKRKSMHLNLDRTDKTERSLTEFQAATELTRLRAQVGALEKAVEIMRGRLAERDAAPSEGMFQLPILFLISGTLMPTL